MTLIFLQSNVKKEAREFLKLAIPLASAEVAQAATSFVDTLMMGWLGRENLAAGGLASMTFFMVLATTTGVVAGVSPLVAEAYGAGQQYRVGQIARQGLWLTLVLAIPMMLLMKHIDVIMYQLGQVKNTIALSKTYLDVMLWGIFPVVGFAVLRNVAAALSQARPVMVIVIGGTLFNAVNNYILGFGKFGFPRMELAGLALASILSQWCMFLALLIYMLKNKQIREYKIFRKIHQLELPILWQLTRIGLPVGISSSFEIGLFTVVSYLMGMLGTDVLAAHQIILAMEFLIFTVLLGMSYATTIRVAQWNGQNNCEAVRQVLYISIFLGTVFMSVITLMLLTHPRQVIGLYLDIHSPENANVLMLATPMLNIAGVVQILDGVQKTTQGALQGLKDTRTPMLLSLLSFWGVGLTVGYFLGFRFALGGIGLWLGQSIGVAISAGFFILRFRKLTSKPSLI
ncbi:MATE family efflux transporter [Calothrix sp. HK-06]|nr:MATE family efflux transporter [Calothrix sp. HK-06]